MFLQNCSYKTECEYQFGRNIEITGENWCDLSEKWKQIKQSLSSDHVELSWLQLHDFVDFNFVSEYNAQKSRKIKIKEIKSSQNTNLKIRSK